MQKPSIPKGTRDFSPAEMMRRQYIFDTIRRVFRAYGFAPLETPSMENLSTLLGKYGDEGDKLLFKILNSGDYAAGLSDEEVRSASKICEKGLRYDLTVPFARYVVQHQGELTFPFKRYQIQPVWRADRPQKGRYREFYQCDVDVIGTRSLLCEVELVEIVERVFKALGIRVALKMNNRKILFGIAEAIGHADKMMDITIAIDKLEKIGLDNVKAELMERGLGQEAVGKLQPILELSGDNTQKLNQLKNVLSVSETGMKGIAEMETVLGYVERLGIDRAYQAIRQADAAVLLIDASRPLAEQQLDTASYPAACCLALTKGDLPACVTPAEAATAYPGYPVIPLSAVTGEGIDTLKNWIADQAGNPENLVITQPRHVHAAQQAAQNLRKAAQCLEEGYPLDLCAVDFHEALRCLGEITGEQVDEKLLDKIFQDFCVGK